MNVKTLESLKDDAANRYNKMIFEIEHRQSKIAQLNDEISQLTAEADKIKGEHEAYDKIIALLNDEESKKKGKSESGKKNQ